MKVAVLFLALLTAGAAPGAALPGASLVAGLLRLGRNLAAARAGAAGVRALSARLLAGLLGGAASAGLFGLVHVLVGTPWIRAGTIAAALVRRLRALLLLIAAAGLGVGLVSGVAATSFSIVLHRISPHVGPLQPRSLALDPAGAALHFERTRSAAIAWDAPLQPGCCLQVQDLNCERESQVSRALTVAK